MTYPINTFYSDTYPNISANEPTPTSIFDPLIIPVGGYAMILGINAANKSASNRRLNLTLKKSEVVTPAYLLFDVVLLPQAALSGPSGDKLVIRRGDSLRAWADSAGANSIDLVISYVVYTPAS